MLYRQGPVLVMGATAAAFTLSLFLSRVVSTGSLVLWLALIVASACFRFIIFAVYRRYGSRTPATGPWGPLFWLGSLTAGFVWGTLPVVLHHQLPAEYLLLLATVFAGMVAVTASAGSVYLPSFYAFAIPLITPLILILLLSERDTLLLTGALLLLFAGVCTALAMRGHRQYQALHLAQYRNTQLTQRVLEEKSHAEQAVVARDRFIAAASHDLRQPLHAIGLLIGSLRVRDSNKARRAIINDLQRSADALSELLHGLLDLSRLDAGVITPAPQRFDARILLQRVADQYKPVAERKGLHLGTEFRQVYLDTDPLLFERIVRNLLDNAIRYTQAGEVVLKLEGNRVAAHLEISDTGSGMSEVDTATAFDEYVRLDQSKHAVAGLGLGLSIVQRFCSLLAIPLTVSSQKGQGSVFMLDLSPKICHPTTSASQTTDSAEAAVAAVSNHQLDLLILVLDDEREVRDAMQRCLVDSGCRVIAAASVRELIAGLANTQRAPDVLLTDFHLAVNYSGLDAVAALREGGYPQLPAALVTADTTEQCLKDAVAAGVTKVLHKPVSDHELVQAVQQLTCSKTPACLS